MIFNAKLLRVDTAGSDPSGTLTFTPGTAVNFDCCIDDPSIGQKWIIGAAIKDATAVMYLPLPASVATQLVEGCRVQAALKNSDGSLGSVSLYRVMFRKDRINDTLSHLEIFLQGF